MYHNNVHQPGQSVRLEEWLAAYAGGEITDADVIVNVLSSEDLWTSNQYHLS